MATRQMKSAAIWKKLMAAVVDCARAPLKRNRPALTGGEATAKFGDVRR
jgi:hypothetical protein